MKKLQKVVVPVLSMITGAGVAVAAFRKVAGKSTNMYQTLTDKHMGLYLMMNQWVKVKQEGKNLASYFNDNDYKTIAIYGMSYAGERLVDELEGSGILVKYGIDKNAEGIYTDIDIVKPDDVLEEVDAIVVTSIFYIDEITDMLEQKVSCPIISLEDVLYEV